MNATLGLVYRAVGAAVAGAADVAGGLPGDSKVLRSARGRRGLSDRLAAWHARGRDLSRRLLWMHAPSVGEGLQARPVLQQLRQRHPDIQLAYTYFSPSAEALGQSLIEQKLVDFADYLAWDTRSRAEGIVDALAPTVLVFAKLDLWPTLADVAARRGVRLGMISATLSATSGRLSRWGASLLSDAYGRIDAVGAISTSDRDRLLQLGVRPSALRVTGDTRYDQVAERVSRVDRTAPPLAALYSHRRPTIVAGSTWPTDEAVLLDGWWEIRKRIDGLRLILAPHEPTPAHLAAVDRWASTHDCQVARLDAPEAATADLVLVDRLGVLAILYAVADVAFVGGGLHRAGLHSIVEPAAFGIPIVFGPYYASSPDAARFLDGQAARSVRDRSGLVDVVTSWFIDGSARYRVGQRAAELFEQGLGATDRSVAMIETLLD